ncbi:MAG: hypothetical protein QXO25_01615 [Candidatus Bathyarchaeia archaeon]
MRAMSTLAGAALLVVGLLMAYFGVYTYTVETPIVETRTIFDGLRLGPIGDYAVKDIELREDYLVNLQGSVTVPGSNSSGVVNLYVMNSDEYQRWRNGEKNIEYLFSRERVERFNVSFSSGENGTFHIVLDNTIDPMYKKEVTLSAKYSYQTTLPEVREEKMLKQAGYPVAVLGVLILVYGLLRKPVVRWE